MLKGFNTIGDLQVYWQICEKSYLESVHREHYQGVIEPLSKLYSYFIEYQARVICHLSTAQLSRAWQDVTGSANWTGTMEKIDSLDRDCRDRFIPVGQQEEIRHNRDAQLQEIQNSRVIQEDILRAMKQGRQDERETKLLQDLAAAAGEYTRYKDVNRERVPGTCEWFLSDERFCKWRDSKSASLLWVSAGPGRGKSVLSKTLIDEGHLNSLTTFTITPSEISISTAPTSSICYFFFKDGDDVRMDGAQALCAMLHQLFTSPSTSGLIKHALSSHKEHGATLVGKFSILWRILIECASSSDTGEIICILDALDECKEDSRQEVIQALQKFYHSHDRSSGTDKFKFLVTSRPYDDLERAFRKFPATSAYLRFDGDDKSEEIRREIDLVIDARIQDIAGGFSASDQRRISERLKSMEHRTYLWLHLTFSIIEESPTEYGRRSDVENLLSNLPSQVSDAYEKILSRSTNQTRTEILLQIVLAAVRPLTLEEANVALTLALQKERFASHAALESELWPQGSFQSIVTNLCGLFVSVYDSRLSLIHQTAREFLIDRNRGGMWKGSLSMTKSHSIISPLCLHYLLLPDLDLVSNISLIEDKFPLLSYAAAHWGLHYASQDDAAAERSRKDARMLCNATGRPASIWVTMALQERIKVSEQFTDLSLAVSYGLKQVVQDILQDDSTDVNTQAGDFGKPLKTASRQGRKEIVQMLLDKGSDVNDQGGIHGTALYAASEGGHNDVVHILLNNGADVNAGLEDRTPLIAASENGHRETVQLLLDKGAYINRPPSSGSYTALHAASKQGHSEIVRILLDRGADINLSDGDYGTAVQFAAAQGREEVVWILLDPNVGGSIREALTAASRGGQQKLVQMLLDRGADINAQGEGLFGTALQAAAGRGWQKLVQMLLDRGADVNGEGGYYGTALQAAAAEGQPQSVQILLDNGAKVDGQCGYYGTALQAASAGGYKDIVQMLLDKGSDINAQGGHYGTTLHAAAEEGHNSVVQALLDKGANANAQFGEYCTALHAASAKGHAAVVRTLLQGGADVNIRGGFHGAALVAATGKGHREVVEILLDNNADTSVGQRDYGTLLYLASMLGQQDVVRLFLDRGVFDVDSLNGDQGTALFAASVMGRSEVVRMLLDHGADVNIKGGEYGTALQAASGEGYKEIVSMLLDKGADVNVEAGEYGTALQLATAEGREEIIQMLVEKGAS